MDNTGGGGGSVNYPGPGGSGGKGVVIIRYVGAQAAGGGTVSSSGEYTVHTFTGDGTFATNSSFGAASTFSIN